ncbi:MAG: amino acid adenylation domain-containing protein, partial [Pseudomonadota bacterium]|nr:amino acid adenylation domain-containing protein [Pseudomonadota bacterium]
MMAVDLYRLCNEKGIRLSVQGADLRVSTTLGTIPDDIKASIREHKQALLSLLTAHDDSESPCLPATHGEVVLSYAQQRLWFQHLYDQDSAIYNIPLVLESREKLDHEVLVASLRWLVARHEPLRTAIRNEAGVATPYRLDPQTFAIVDHSDTGEATATVERLAAAQTSVPFDLASDFMIRVDLLHRREGSLVFVTLHHIAADGWSLNLLIKELNTAYDAIAQGDAPDATALPHSFSAYAAWQLSQLQGGALDTHLSYWKGRLAGIPEMHRFPLDKARPVAPSHRGDRHRFGLDEATGRRLQALASAQGCTMFALVQAAFAVFVSRYSDSPDVVFGTPVSNRTLPGTAGLVGYLANVVPVRTKIVPGVCFVDVLRQASVDFVDDLPHHGIPMEMLIDALKLGRRASHNPLLQLMLVFEEGSQGPADAVAGPTLRRSAQERAQTGSKFDLSLIVRHSAAGLAFAWEYSSDLFDPATMPRLAANFVKLLHSIATAPETPVSDLDMLAEQEKAFLSEIGTGRAVDIGDAAVHRLFERWVLETPQSIALIRGDEEVTYQELDEQANGLAWLLIERGVVRGDVVGLCLEHPGTFPLIAMAVMKAGAAYLPMDPRYPAKRIKHIVEDSGACLWLTDGDTPDLTSSGARVLRVADALIASADLHRHSPTVQVGAADLAYVIYTSGSTGLPKGTLLEHRGAANLAMAQKALFDVTGDGPAQSRVLQFASISFDAATWELLMALCNGARLVIPEPQDKQDPVAIARLMSDRGVSHATLPPAYLATFRRDSLPSLRHLIVAGEAISWAEAQKWAEGRNFYNAYGPTETTVCATVGQYREGRVHMGRPISNHKCTVLDARGHRVAVGAIGELHIGGFGLARGYRNCSQLTEEMFVVRSVAGALPERWYRSGDLVRWLPDGNLEYIGRTDTQVKIRGFRIELGEIEVVLASHPDITAVHVSLWQPEGSDESRLTAYYSLAAGSGAGNHRSVVRQFMEQRLPDYMVPAAYVPMTVLPLTLHGKIDADALPPPGDGDTAQQDYVAPSTASQRLICSILSELLPAAQISIKDGFYALGGDSILSIRAVARINAHGHRLTSRQFFDAQTVEGIAALLDASLGAGAAFNQEPSCGKLELLPIQRRFLALRSGQNDRYLQSALLHVPEGVDEAFLGLLLPALYARHDLLRLRVGDTDGPEPNAWFQPVADVEPMAALSVVRQHGLSQAERMRGLEEAGDEYKAAISIAGGKLFSLVLFDADTPRDRRLLVIFHHLIVDGVSWRIFLDDLALAYEQYQRDGDILLPARTTSFQEWSARLSARSAERGSESERPWPLELGDGSNYDTFLRGSRNELTEDVSDTLGDSQTVVAALDSNDTQALLQGCQFAYRTQINDLLLAALVVALEGWRGVTRHEVFMESHGRDHELFEDTDLGQCLGWFTTIYPVCVGSHGAEEEGIRATILDAKRALKQVPHLGLGYLGGERLTVKPAIVFNYLGQFDQQLGQASSFARAPEFTGFDVDRRRRREYLLGFNGRVADGRLTFNIDFSRHWFDAADVAALATGFEDALRSVLSHCRQQTRSWASPSDFPLCVVSQDDLEQWQREFGDIDDVYPASGSQLGMLYHAQLDGGTSYSTQNLVHFPPGFDPVAFKRAWELIVQRHAVLRTVFVGLEREESLQLVQSKVKLAWNEQDLSHLPSDLQKASIDDYLRDDNREPLDPRHAPLARFALFKTEGGRFVLVWTCSHAILDGWSLGIVYDELLVAYEAMRESREPALAPAVEYRRYIEWTQAQNTEDAHHFWSEELAGVVTDEHVGIEAASADPGAGKRTVRHTLPEGDHGSLKRFAAEHNITVSTLVLAAWAYLLGRYGDSDVVTTGMTLSGRPAELPRVEDIVGLMVSTVPAVVRMVREESIVGWLQTLHDRQRQRETHAHVSLAEIIKLAEMEDGQTAFNTALGFHSQPTGNAASAMNEAGIKGGVGHEHTHYPLVVGVSPHGNMQFTVTYDASKFTSTAMERLCVHLENALKALISPLSHTVGDLDVLAIGEHAALTGLAQGPAALREPVLVPDLIARQARARGDAPALLFEDEILGFSALEARANQLARALLAAGVQVGDRVGVCQERTLDLLASVIGVMKAGAVYVPLDPGYPDERLAHLLADAGIGHVLTEAHLAPQLPLSGRSVVLVSSADGQDTTAFESPVTRSSPAYMIYTSGSTGQPKGVVISHGALADKLAALAQHYELDETDRGLLFASMSFDASLSQLLVPLAVGGSVVLRPDGLTEPEALLAYVAAQRVTWMHVVPAYLRQLLEVPDWS